MRNDVIEENVGLTGWGHKDGKKENKRRAKARTTDDFRRDQLVHSQRKKKPSKLRVKKQDIRT